MSAEGVSERSDDARGGPRRLSWWMNDSRGTPRGLSVILMAGFAASEWKECSELEGGAGEESERL